jgi:hypothetical protein
MTLNQTIPHRKSVAIAALIVVVAVGWMTTRPSTGDGFFSFLWRNRKLIPIVRPVFRVVGQEKYLEFELGRAHAKRRAELEAMWDRQKNGQRSRFRLGIL